MLALLSTLSSTGASANPIIEGREWLQPLLTRGYSWDDFNAVCAGGTCSGRVDGDGYDLTGWEWASIFEVGELFAATTPHPGGLFDYTNNDYNYIDSFLLETGFNPTFTLAVIGGIVFEPVTLVGGLSSTLDATTGQAYTGYVASGGQNYLPSLAIDGSRISTLFQLPADGTGLGQSGTGGWFYRSAENPIPVATSPALLGLAVLILHFFRRRT